ncbi:hypothetical protein SAMN04487859_12217 [Roseovarius lutimaris]|uniref:Peptidase MA superfamily protein n=1 Tax=Roseovarius lutimaris TaxID=1005928 RepID=A0A1I5FU66_9RHOB|nr:hypothetical protein [Roseovarius lutimaris]SFO27327.1 hypothetical protein SAMN04487859_12217 [Roseovarius lutimaris]
MRALTFQTATLMLLSWPVHSETLSCAGSKVTVTALRAHDARLACDAAAHAKTLFESCNIPAITRPLRISVVEDLKPNCFGQYHCGEDRIELLAPPAMQARLSPDSAYGELSNDAFFKSIAVHELTHSALDDMPCPFKACLVAHEYIAYVMQAMSLSPEAQRQFVKGVDLERKVSRDELNPFIYFMAPDLFARKAWLHFSQRDDPCGFVGQIVDGAVLLDYERFE